MEFFNSARTVRLRNACHGKYLVADEDEAVVRQSFNGSVRQACWTVERIPGKSHLVRLRSCSGKYLSATDEPYRFSISGKKVALAKSTSRNNKSVEWEPSKDGEYVKLKGVRAGMFLRGNGSMPPWRSSVTHDLPRRSSTQDWVMWRVDVVDIVDLISLHGNLSNSSSSWFSEEEEDDDDDDDEEDESGDLLVELELERLGLSMDMNYGSNRKSGMEFFLKAKSVRLRSHHDKYLMADNDEVSVCQDRNGSIKQAKWTVEFVPGADVIRLKSCYGKYLMATNVSFLLGMTGKKVRQTVPPRLDSSLEWEPMRDGFQVRLKTRYGNFLRANGGLPPWRNSITHDIPHRSATRDWILWEVDVVEARVEVPKEAEPKLDSTNVPAPAPPVPEPDSMSSEITLRSPRTPRLDKKYSFGGSPAKSEGRMIYYKVADEDGHYEPSEEGFSFTFKGSRLEELVERLEYETGLEDIVVCSQWNGKLYPLRLQLPPNNAAMHIVVLLSSSEGHHRLLHSGERTRGSRESECMVVLSKFHTSSATKTDDDDQTEIGSNALRARLQRILFFTIDHGLAK